MPGLLARALQAIGLGRAIKSVFPELEAGRMARRLSGWNPSRAHVNTLIGASGKTVLARARYLTRNNGYAAGATECFAANLIGTGIHPSWQIKAEGARDAVRDLWKLWVDECDAEGVTNFYGLQRRIARELFIAGECFVRFRPRRPIDNLSVPLQLELLPSEQLPTERNLWLANGNRVRQGIEFDKIGRRVAYHFWKVHPGDVTQSQNFGVVTIVPAGEVLHIHDPIESGQIRGLPRMTPAIVSLWMLDAYDDAEMERKKTAALFSVFVKRLEQTPSVFDRAAEEAAAASGDDEVIIDLQPGVAHQLKPGEDVTVAAPAEVGNTYDMFQYRNLCRFCSAVGLPYSGVTGDKARANYSNERSALLDMRRRMGSLQSHVICHQLCKPVLRRWLDTVVLSGALNLAGYAKDPSQFQATEWIAPPWDWVDPLKDRMAELIGVNAGFKPRSRVVEAEGYDPMENDQQIADDAARAAKLEIAFQGAPTQAGVTGAPPPGSAPPPGEVPPEAPTEDAVAAMLRLTEAFERMERAAAAATPINGLAH